MQELAVRIYWGTTDGALSHTPLVSVGAMEEDYDPVGPTLVKDDQVWMLVNGSHCNICASYVRAKTMKDEQPFQLLICLFIPVGQRLADEKSPLEVLDALGKKFDDWFGMSRGLMCSNQSKANATMRRVLANYRLEECPFYVFQMEGVQPGSFRVESISQLSALMRYSNYYPIAQINCLEMSFNCKSTVDINTKGESNDKAKKTKWQWWWKREKLQKKAQHIWLKLKPKKKTTTPIEQNEGQCAKENSPNQHKGYQVLVNGEPQNVFLRWDDDMYSLHLESTEDFRYESLRFKLGELKSAPKRRVATLSGRVVAQLDEKNGCINCEMKPVEKWLYKEITFTDDSDVEARKFVKYNPDKIQILIGREPWKDDKIKPSEAKKAMERNIFRLATKEIDDYRFALVSTKIVKDRITLIIDAKNKHQAISETKQFQQPSQQQQKQEEKTAQKRQETERNEERKRTGKRNVVAVDDRVAYKKKEKKEIKMPPKYQVWVNGVAQDVFLQSEYDKYEVRLPRCETLGFDLGRLKSLPNHTLQSSTGNTIVRLDQDNQRIVCELKPKEREVNDNVDKYGIHYPDKYGIRYTYESDSSACKYFEENIGKTIFFYYQNHLWQGEKYTEYMFASDLRISPSVTDDYLFSVNNIWQYYDPYVVEIRAKKRKSNNWYRTRAINAINYGEKDFRLFFELIPADQEIVKWFLNITIEDAKRYVGFEQYIRKGKKKFNFDNWEQIETLYQECNNKKDNEN